MLHYFQYLFVNVDQTMNITFYKHLYNKTMFNSMNYLPAVDYHSKQNI